MATMTKIKVTAAATAIPTIPAKPMPEVSGVSGVSGTGVTDGCGAELEDEETGEALGDDTTTGTEEDVDIAGVEVEGTETSIDEGEEGEGMEVGVASVEDESATEEGEGVGSGNVVVESSESVRTIGNEGTVSGEEVTINTIETSSE